MVYTSSFDKRIAQQYVFSFVNYSSLVSFVHEGELPASTVANASPTDQRRRGTSWLGELKRLIDVLKREKQFTHEGEDLTEKKISYFIDLEEADELTQMEGLTTKILTGLAGENMMMVLNYTLPGHTVPKHAHPHEQIGMVYAGKAKLQIGKEEKIVEKGDFYCIPPHVEHSDTCIGEEPFVMLDIFYPVREDFIAKLKSQKV